MLLWKNPAVERAFIIGSTIFCEKTGAPLLFGMVIVILHAKSDALRMKYVLFGQHQNK